MITKPGIELRLISGSLGDKKGPAHSDVFTATLRMKKGSSFEIKFPESDNVAVYVLEGNLIINNSTPAVQHRIVIFENKNGNIILGAESDSKLLLMSGTPINEKLVKHGPFVMNSETEILEAMRDYKQGKMGYLY